MEPQIESIRAALAPDASDELRAAGAAACRTLLVSLQPPDAEPAPSQAPSAPPLDTAAIASLVGALGKLPPEQLLDLAIARLRAALPAEAPMATAPPTPLKFHIIPLPRHGSAPSKTS